MELEVGGGSVRRRRLSDDGRDAWAGLTLGAVLGNDKRPGPPVQVSRTLLDIIRDEEPNTGAYKNLINHHNNKKNWKSFKDRLRLRRAGNAWTSSVHTPATDAATAAAMQISRSQLSRRNSTRMPPTNVPNSGGESAEDASEQVVCDYSTRTCGPQMSRRNSTRIPSHTAESNQSPAGITESDDPPVVEQVPVQISRSLMLRRNSSRIPSLANQSTPSDPFNEYESAAPSIRLSAALAAEREQIQRVVSSSEAATEAERQNADEETAEEVNAPSTEAGAGQQPVRMSLMDLLEETDRQMGWVSYSAEDGEEEEEVEEESGDVHDQGGGGGGGVQEYTCCVCMVRHKGAAFIPCGHTFCRLCSRELWVSRGNCPLCNGFILEILDIF